MKNCINIILLLLICCFTNSLAQENWKTVYNVKAKNSLGSNASAHFIGIKSPNKKDLLVVSNMDYRSPFMVKSSDSGLTWEIKHKEKFPGNYDGVYFAPSRANAFAYPDTTLAIVVCDSGYYYYSTDNCETWTKDRFENQLRSFQISFWDNKIGIVFQNTEPGEQVLQKTTDGGQSWYQITGPEPINQLGVSYLETHGDGIAYFIEVDNKVDSVYYFHKSTDYGETWSVYPGPEIPPFGDFYFHNQNLGFCYYGEEYSSVGGMTKVIRRTSDGGKSWQVVMDTAIIPNDPIVDIHFADTLNGIAVALANIFWTNDGGKTWREDTSFSYISHPDRISYVYMIDNFNAVGIAMNSYNNIYRYTGVDPSSVTQSFPIKQLKLFPNPTHELLQIELADEHNYDEYLIYDVKGALLQKSLFTGEVPIGNLPKGAYYLLLYSPTRTGYGQFVKE
ncbi:MAG: hypothetical protein IAE98_11385 [Candidatus Kapabacteria bacterium]|nr:hypothetical protein [Candidatus Kapabacteria bacterium]